MINYNNAAGHLEDILTDDNLIYPFEFIARAVAEYNQSLGWSNYGFAYMYRQNDMITVDISFWKELYFRNIPGTIYYMRIENPSQEIEERLQQIKQETIDQNQKTMYNRRVG